ncbi:hypothetical protein PDL71_15550 [Lacibacter sp. MH-610]
MQLNSDKQFAVAPQQAFCQYGVKCSAVDGLFYRSIELLKKSFKQRGG